MSYDAAGNRKAVNWYGRPFVNQGGTAFSAGYSGFVNYSYDSLDRLTSETDSRVLTSPGGSQIPSGDFFFIGNNTGVNATAMLNANGGGNANTFVSDNANNLTTIRSSAGQTYNEDNQVTTSSDIVFDGDGNPTTYIEGFTGSNPNPPSPLSFDQNDRMTSAGNAGAFIVGPIYMSYYPDGRRASHRIGVSVTSSRYCFYDGDTLLYEKDYTNAYVMSAMAYGAGGLMQRRAYEQEIGYQTMSTLSTLPATRSTSSPTEARRLSTRWCSTDSVSR